jgi:hypothetical protein
VVKGYKHKYHSMKAYSKKIVSLHAYHTLEQEAEFPWYSWDTTFGGTHNFCMWWYSSLHLFGCWPWWESLVCGPQNEGRKRKETILSPSPPSFPSLPSDFRQVTCSEVSQAKNAGTGYASNNMELNPTYSFYNRLSWATELLRYNYPS